MENLKAIVLAAGEGSRMKSKTPKVLHKILNKTMLDYVIDTAQGCGAESVCVVVGHKAEEVKAGIAHGDVAFALQKEQKGTGHAAMMAADFIEDGKGMLILYGDTPLITSESLARLAETHRAEGNGVTVVSAILDDPAGYGRIVRDSAGDFLKIVEHKDASAGERGIKEINTGIYIFRGKALRESLQKLDNRNAQGEYYLTDCLEGILRDGGRVGVVTAEDAGEFFGVNSRAQLAEAAGIMRERVNRRHMESGVTIIDPANTYIDPGVEIGMDTVILPGCVLEGDTAIGEDCEVGPHTCLTDMKIGNGVKIRQSTAVESEIGDGAVVGPFAYIRPGCHIGNRVKVGDFVEVKNSAIGDGTKIPHLSYVGDTDAGERINFGCGSIMVNYDGQIKHRTTIGDDVFVGCNVNLVAPVTVEKGAYIAAGSTITKDVPEDVLAVARARQQVIKGWKEKRFRK